MLDVIVDFDNGVVSCSERSVVLFDATGDISDDEAVVNTVDSIGRDLLLLFVDRFGFDPLFSRCGLMDPR